MSTQWNTTHQERNELLIHNNLDGSQKYYAEFPNKPVSKGYILQKKTITVAGIRGGEGAPTN